MTEFKKDNCCRVCLGKVKKRDRCIDEEVNELPIFQHIMSVAEVKIKVNDGLPNRICLKCLTDLETAIRFKRKCEECNIVLHASLTHANDSVTPNEEEVHVPKVKNEFEDTLELGNEETYYDLQALNDSCLNDDFSDGGRSDDEISTKCDYANDVKNENDQVYDNTNFKESNFYDDSKELLMNLPNDNKGEHSLPQCDDCKEYFLNKLKLQVHWKRVHLPALLTCQSCQRTFKALKALRGHQKKQPRTCLVAPYFLIQVSEGHRTRVCKLCGIKCEDSQMVYHYITTHTDQKWHSIPKPKNEYTKITDTEPPKQRDENSYKIDLHLQCDDCKEFFRTKTKLGVHWKRVHLPECDMSCKYCKRKFKTYKALRKHETMKFKHCIEASKYKIEVVGKTRWFLCNHCGYKANRLCAMPVHNRIHTGEKPYVCNICGEARSQISSLLQHKESAHQMYKQISTCQYCGKLLKGYNSIRKHLESHDASLQVQCDICKKYCKNKTILRLHMFRHAAGGKTFRCELCHKMFYTTAERGTHFSNIHKKAKRKERKLYNCAQCSYHSLVPEAVQNHEAKHELSKFYCELCGTFFTKLSRLEHHKTVGYCCPHCDKKICYKDRYDSHIRIHCRLDASIRLNKDNKGGRSRRRVRHYASIRLNKDNKGGRSRRRVIAADESTI